MRIRLKRIGIASASLLLGLGALSACSSGADTSSGDTPQAGNNVEPKTLTFFIHLDDGVAKTSKTYNDAPWVQEAERRTGIHIDFIHQQFNDDLNLLIASGDYPDLFNVGWKNYPGGAVQAAGDKVIIGLSDLMEQHAPNITDYFRQYPEMKKLLTSEDGEIYQFPTSVSDTGRGASYMGPVINKGWLDKLGLSVPTTIAEWETVLKAFKEKDPNGNGKADEIPIVGQGINNFLWVNFPFGIKGITSEFYQKDGVVKYAPLEPEFKEALLILNKWYANGWIDNEILTTDYDLLRTKIASGKAGAAFFYTTGLALDKSSEWVGAPFPSFHKGDQPLVGSAGSPWPGTGVSISTTNPLPIETVKWLDYWFGEEGIRLVNYGVEGLSYNLVNGKPQFTDLIKMNADGLDPASAAYKYTGLNISWPKIQDWEAYIQFNEILSLAAGEALELWSQPVNHVQIPVLSLRSDESRLDTAIMTDIRTYYAEMIVKFVIGHEQLSNYDKFVETLKELGIEKDIQIRQAALDRYN